MISSVDVSSLFPECYVCFNTLNESLASLPCGHVFHQTCLNLVIIHSHKCPICRREANETAVIKLIYDVSNQNIEQINSKMNRNESEVEKINILLQTKLIENETYLQNANKKLNKVIFTLKKSNNLIINLQNKRLYDCIDRKQEENDFNLLLNLIPHLEHKLENSQHENIELKDKLNELNDKLSMRENIFKSFLNSDTKKKNNVLLNSNTSSSKNKSIKSKTSSRRSINKTFIKMKVIKKEKKIKGFM
jgi:hypothetical protein